jgi:CelD/BcsL family acetyltransferase involved in cellulose biosynthesis
VAPIKELTPVATDGARRWDEYVRGHPRGSVYHLSGWAAIIRRAYGYAPRYLAVEEAGRLRGVLPLFAGSGLVFGRRLSSMPVARTSGPLADTIELEAGLLESARALQEQEGVAHAVVRSTRAGYDRLAPAWTVLPDQPTWQLSLPGDADELDAALRRRSQNVARSIRRAERSGVQVREGTSAQDLRRFFGLYLATMRRHRALPRRLAQLEAERQVLGPSGTFRLWLAEADGETVAGGVFHAFGDTLELLYNASDDARLELRPNHMLYVSAMRWAIEQGLGRFDFGGATPGTSLAHFKSQWGAEPVPIHLYTTGAGTVRGDTATGEGPASPWRQRLDAAWERAPLELTRVAGAVAYRFL